MAEIAHFLGWSHQELMAMEVDELLAWHDEVAQLHKRLNGPQT